MKKRKILSVFCIVATISFSLNARILPELNYPAARYVPEKWKSFWITCEDAPQADYAVTLYRRTFDLDSKPEKFIIHVSADNRYKLYVNGKMASIGPQLSDQRHWRFETIDIAPYLQKGKNILAAEVINWGTDRFFGIMSLRTALMVQGNSDKESIVNTDVKWKTYHNKAYSPVRLNWRFGVDIVGGFYASNPGDKVELSKYPENWNSIIFNDEEWPSSLVVLLAGSNQGHGWLLKARTTPQVVQKIERFPRVARTEGVTIPQNFLKGSSPFVVPANSKVTVLLDFNVLTIGYPELIFSGGNGGKVTIRYAENLLDKNRQKGDRNDIAGKTIRGLHDIILCNGAENFTFSPLWYRTFRFVQLDIETASQPLTVNDYYQVTTVSPMKKRAIFECDDRNYKKIEEICWRTVWICTQDNLMSDAYYEQMMYLGDSKVHARVNMVLSGESIWLKNAIEQIAQSQMPNGMMPSCYPLNASFFIPNFPLDWIEMIHDYMMYVDDKPFVAAQMQGIRNVLYFFHENRLENGLYGSPWGKCFVDWYSNTKYAGRGITTKSEKGNSATVSLMYASTLLKAAEISDYLGLKSESAMYRKRAEQMKKDVYKSCWDDTRRMFAENPDKEFFNEQANIMAISAGMFNKKFQTDLFYRTFSDTTIAKAAYFFRYNYFLQMSKLGIGDDLDMLLDIWKDLIPYNLTTTPERIARQRSEAHPWSASPAAAFINIAAGINPAEPGFKSVKIEPAFGKLSYINASYPHYLGDIRVELKKTDKKGIIGTIILPKGLTGIFIFGGKSMKLKTGEQKINF